jgi:hypothetical protein
MSTRNLAIFVSSKQTELDDERQTAKSVIESFNFEPIMSEVRAAGPNSARNVCLEEVESCDIYIGIFYREYSEVTEAEYHKAIDKRIPCLIFIKKLRENEHRDGSLIELLKKIHSPTEGQWTNDFEHVEELREKVRTSLLRLLISRFHQGVKVESVI